MKRKITVILATFLLLALCLTALGACSQTQNNLMLIKDYFVDVTFDSLNVRIDVVDGSVTLNGDYTITKQNDGYYVEYTYQKLNAFTMVDGELVPPSEKVSQFSGKATVVNEIVKSYEGDPLNINVARLSLSSFDFNRKNFGTIELESEYLGPFKYIDTYRGDIINPLAFAGIDATKMNFVAVRGAVEHKTFTLTYVDANNVGTVITYTIL